MAHAEICPVCKGSGVFKTNKCHGCDGLGWVTVGTEYPQKQNTTQTQEMLNEDKILNAVLDAVSKNQNDFGVSLVSRLYPYK